MAQPKYTDKNFTCLDNELIYCMEYYGKDPFEVLMLSMSAASANRQMYLEGLRQPFVKLCRLRFLNPDGSLAFALDNSPHNRRNSAFVADGDISVNLQNGQRRTANVTLQNIDAEFDYNVNNLWFGDKIALDEGMLLRDGTEYYIQQGVFLIDEPSESNKPDSRTIQYSLVDKWANLDGTLYGNLDGTYEVQVGTENIFVPIAEILKQDKGNGEILDNINPVFTEFYNTKTQLLPDGTSVSMLEAPYTLTLDSDSNTLADVITGLTDMVNALVGYDAYGALRVDPSQDDVSDLDKPVIWQFSHDEVTLQESDYTYNNTEVYNDYIIVGEQLDDNTQPAGRAQNFDPKSDTNINIIGRKTYRESASGFSTDRQCIDTAVWRLKRSTVLQKEVKITCGQILHLDINKLITVVRTDKPGAPVERHLIQGFSRSLVSSNSMTINAISVNDYPDITETRWNNIEWGTIEEPFNPAYTFYISDLVCGDSRAKPMAGDTIEDAEYKYTIDAVDKTTVFCSERIPKNSEQLSE